MALTKAGCTVMAVCPLHHPLATTRAAEQIHTYNGLVPLRALENAIAATSPDLILPCDDLATQHLHQIYQKVQRLGKAGRPIFALIERSLGEPICLTLFSARAAFMDLAPPECISVTYII